MFYLLPKVIQPEICDEIIKECKQNILEKATVKNPDQTRRDDSKLRKTEIHTIKDKDHKTNNLLWHFIREVNDTQFHYDIEAFEYSQFLEYKNNGFYEWHQDGNGMSPNNKTRKLSATLVLSDPKTFEGGEFQFFSGNKLLAKDVIDDLEKQGTIIIFDSTDWHRVTPVVSGTRHSIVSWAVGKNFK